MLLIDTETLVENVERPMKDFDFVDLIEHLRAMQEQAHELAVQQLELTHNIEVAIKKARKLHQKSLADKNDVRGEG